MKVLKAFTELFSFDTSNVDINVLIEYLVSRAFAISFLDLYVAPTLKYKLVSGGFVPKPKLDDMTLGHLIKPDNQIIYKADPIA